MTVGASTAVSIVNSALNSPVFVLKSKEVGSVGVVESFSSITSGGGQVLVGFEFPVGPSNKFLVSDVGNLLNLLSARAFG
jgi:hypothetical protein